MESPSPHRFDILSGNLLKIIAAISMVADHVGVIFFPEVQIFRYIGRLALPIFAVMIAEGCRYTKNKLRYFLSVFLLGVGCQAVYYVVSQSLYLNILLTFSLSILTLYALQYFKATLIPGVSTSKRILAAALFLLTVAAVVILNRLLVFDYGIWGCMLPVFAGLTAFPHPKTPDTLKRLDRKPFHLLSLTVGMIMLIVVNDTRQYFSLLTLPLLALYSGKRGKYKMKYFFYIFYPAHLALLQGLYFLINGSGT